MSEAAARRTSAEQWRSGRREERARARCASDSARLRRSQVKRARHAQWHFQMQLSWGPLLLAHPEKNK